MNTLEKCKEYLQKGQIYELQDGVKVYKIEKESTSSTVCRKSCKS